MSQENVYEVAIIGAGPIGIELAVALKRLGIKYIQFDAKQIGYTISWFAPQTRFFSSSERIAIAGVPFHTPEQSKATREQYLTYLRTVVEHYDLQINTYEPVIDIQQSNGIFLLTSQSQTGHQQYRALRVVLATGGTDRPRMLNIPGEDLPHVSHYFTDPHMYFRKRLLIVGGRNSAVEAALRCHQAGAKVTLSYRRPDLIATSIKYWLMPEIQGLMKNGRITAYFNSVPTSITSESVSLKFHDKEFRVAADFVLLLTGYEQDNKLLIKAGVDLQQKRNAPAYDPQTMMTSVHNLYVAGTCIGGTQEKFTIFIENCHDHVDKIIKSMFGKTVERKALMLTGEEE